MQSSNRMCQGKVPEWSAVYEIMGGILYERLGGRAYPDTNVAASETKKVIVSDEGSV